MNDQQLEQLFTSVVTRMRERFEGSAPRAIAWIEGQGPDAAAAKWLADTLMDPKGPTAAVAFARDMAKIRTILAALLALETALAK